MARTQPQKPVTMQERADYLRTWMTGHRYNGRAVSQGALERLSGISESIIDGVFARGDRQRDIAGLRAATVARLVSAMRQIDPELTGESIALMLRVPPERLDRWRGAEKALAQDEATEGAVMLDEVRDEAEHGKAVLLLGGLRGSVTLGSAWTAMVAPDVAAAEGLWLVAGQHWALPSTAWRPGQAPPSMEFLGWIRALISPY